jgi:hypothetical protein
LAPLQPIAKQSPPITSNASIKPIGQSTPLQRPTTSTGPHQRDTNKPGNLTFVESKIAEKPLVSPIEQSPTSFNRPKTSHGARGGRSVQVEVQNIVILIIQYPYYIQPPALKADGNRFLKSALSKVDNESSSSPKKATTFNFNTQPIQDRIALDEVRYTMFQTQ